MCQGFADRPVGHFWTILDPSLLDALKEILICWYQKTMKTMENYSKLWKTIVDLLYNDFDLV